MLLGKPGNLRSLVTLKAWRVGKGWEPVELGEYGKADEEWQRVEKGERDQPECARRASRACVDWAAWSREQRVRGIVTSKATMD